MYTVSSLGLKSIWLLALVLIALVAASVDAAPDPPALDPHAANVKAGKATRLDDFVRILRTAGPEADGSITARSVPRAEIIERNQVEGNQAR